MDYKKKIDILFGANDSELKGWEYTIPEGMEAEIKDGKVIVRQKESKDERIRKQLINEVKEQIENIPAPDCCDSDDLQRLTILQSWLAYLEKQKDANKEYWRGYREGKQEILDKYAEIEKQKEQKPVQDREEREYVRTLKSLIVDFLRDKECVNRGYYQDIYDWLDGRHIEQQPKQEWSEEDEKNWNEYIERLKAEYSKTPNVVLWDDINWLEYLHERLKSLRPQPHWKPSEEQMKALEFFIRSWGESGTMSHQNTILCAANSLYADLQKLM